VSKAASPYESTEVSVERSQTQIRHALRDAGAAGIQFEEEWGDEPTFRVRFGWPTEGGQALKVVRLEVSPLPPLEPGYRNGRYSQRKISREQRERQAWRGLAWYLDSNLKAATFGLIPFEAIFLAHFEDRGGRTIGEALIPELQQGRLALPPGGSGG